jgi:hypothetical protein
MPKHLVWMSRHVPTPRQQLELNRLFPEHTLTFEPAPFSGADQIVARFKAAGGDEMIVVAPWTVVRELVKHGLRPIYSEMKQIPCSSPEREVSIGAGRRRRCYKFVRFHYCDGVELKLVAIQPPPSAGSTVHNIGCDCGFCKMGTTRQT